MRILTTTSLAVTVAVAISCSVGSDVCGEGYVEKLGACQKKDETGGTNPTATSDADLDAFTDDAKNETITGLGDDCVEQSNCEGKDADYCALDPVTGVGVCTITDCTTDPDNCPVGYRCCRTPEELDYPLLCLSQSQYEFAVGISMCLE